MKQFSYVIVADGSVARAGVGGAGAARRAASAGRHRAGVPGTVLRYPAGAPRPACRRARRRRHGERPSTFAIRYATLLVLLAAVGVSGWFAATGASAVAQMIQP